MHKKNLLIILSFFLFSLNSVFSYCGDGNLEINETCSNCPQEFWNLTVDVMANSTNPYINENSTADFYYNSQNCSTEFSTFNCSFIISNSTSFLYYVSLNNCSFSSNNSWNLIRSMNYTTKTYDRINVYVDVVNYNITHQYYYQYPVNCSSNWSNITEWALDCLNISTTSYVMTFEDLNRCDEYNSIYNMYDLNETCDYSSCGDSYCNQNVYVCDLGSCVLNSHESIQNCCNDCGVPNEFYLCDDNELYELKNYRTLKDVGGGVGGFISLISENILLIMIVISIIIAVGLIFNVIGQETREGGLYGTNY